MVWKDVLGALSRREELSADETAWGMGEIMQGNATPAQIAGFALLLRAKGETAAELAALVDTMLSHAIAVEQTPAQRDATVDVVGTGGDQSHTVNISTMASLVVASAGVRVIKHGNRAASSSCGTADVLEYLGVPLMLSPAQIMSIVDDAGIAFCFAQAFHPGVRHAGPVRRELGVPTVFNFLGPLTNPARPRSGAIGCSDVRMAPLMASVYAGRGDTVLVMRGEDGLDEFSTGAPTRIWAAHNGAVTSSTVDALDLGLPRSTLADLRGDDAAFNANILRRVLNGESGAVRDAVLINAAAALTAHDWHRDGLDDLPTALRRNMIRAQAALDSGAAASTLDKWIAAAAKHGGSPA